jgi:hypothetical protein
MLSEYPSFLSALSIMKIDLALGPVMFGDEVQA